ncbi:hypothetical protein K438DRAFT_2075885 [Mycena galopus ATCC 62051]|nr:hypothetical protein K438DRAFT_2075885 [Mycena galopus ATCC 62051]
MAINIGILTGICALLSMGRHCPCEASRQLASETLTDLLKSGVCLRLEHINIDALEKEASRFNKDRPARNGLPYRIDSSCTAKRGTNHVQGYIFPPMWRTTGKQKSAHNLSELVLCNLDYTYCALILDLGPLFLMIQWLTHTSAHFFSRVEWETPIKLTDKNVRKNRVGLALVFKAHVLAFLIVFQNDLACDVIRGESTVFLGIGVYTVNELFFLAGLSPLLTEAEVFLNPSRTARFAGAYLELLNRSRTGLKYAISFPALPKPVIKNGHLAPTVEQRLKYQDWLHVYAKNRARVLLPMAALVDHYLLKLQELPLGDPRANVGNLKFALF